MSDTPVIHNQMRGYWKIVNVENQIIKSKEIFNKQWDVRSPKAAEAIMILDMLEFSKNSMSP